MNLLYVFNLSTFSSFLTELASTNTYTFAQTTGRPSPDKEVVLTDTSKGFRTVSYPFTSTSVFREMGSGYLKCKIVLPLPRDSTPVTPIKVGLRIVRQVPPVKFCLNLKTPDS